jgi:glycine/sarcosine N-methyltransferase
MDSEPAAFYDELAEFYHLIFEDWDGSIARQAEILGPIIKSAIGSAPLTILDCACGIGTQAMGLAQRGHNVTASDLSQAAVDRARREAARRGLTIRFLMADMRDLSLIPLASFDVVMAADNALPHLLQPADLKTAVAQFASMLRAGGLLLITMRDYDALLESRPAIQTPAFYSSGGKRRIVHQVWDWEGDQYTLHLHMTIEAAAGWEAHHFASRYRAMQRAEVFAVLAASGFEKIEFLRAEETGFYQPIILARKAQE